MTPIEIVLILMGIGILVASMFLVDKPKNTKEEFNNDGNGPSRLTQVDMEAIRKKVDLVLSDVTEEVLQSTDEKLSHLSNEKIIAVTDYSNQILEKINQNHEEVIFLYNMLTDKESELKDLIRQLQSIKKDLKETAYQIANETKVYTTGNGEKDTTNTNAVNKNALDSKFGANSIETENFRDRKTKKGKKQQLELNQVVEKNSENNNDKILELYKQGKSIVEISKSLDLGQGEVKLVIDLFNKRR